MSERSRGGGGAAVSEADDRLLTRASRTEAYISARAFAVAEEGGKASQSVKTRFQLPAPPPVVERERGGRGARLECRCSSSSSGSGILFGWRPLVGAWFAVVAEGRLASWVDVLQECGGAGFAVHMLMMRRGVSARSADCKPDSFWRDLMVSLDNCLSVRRALIPFKVCGTYLHLRRIASIGARITIGHILAVVHWRHSLVTLMIGGR